MLVLSACSLSALRQPPGAAAPGCPRSSRSSRNLHGDVTATVANDPETTELDERFETDEFGNPRQPADADHRYGWLGSERRRTELGSGVIQMGVRSYVPVLGRFTSVDPVLGGASTAYDYARADPVNNGDLMGTCTIPLRNGRLPSDHGQKHHRNKRTGKPRFFKKGVGKYYETGHPPVGTPCISRQHPYGYNERKVSNEQTGIKGTIDRLCWIENAAALVLKLNPGVSAACVGWNGARIFLGL